MIQLELWSSSGGEINSELTRASSKIITVEYFCHKGGLAVSILICMLILRRYFYSEIMNQTFLRSRWGEGMNFVSDRNWVKKLSAKYENWNQNCFEKYNNIRLYNEIGNGHESNQCCKNACIHIFTVNLTSIFSF